MAKQGSCCELCGSDAKMFCESDQARLCWDCDDKVHAANFLVAKHTRTALCHVCHSPTPWKASGPRLGRTISVCGVCVARSAGAGGRSVGNRGEIAEEEEEGDGRSRDVRISGEEGGGYVQREEVGDDECDDDDSEDDDDSDGDDFGGCDDADGSDDDDDENQVVPWTPTPEAPPASATSTSCSEEEESSTGGGEGESVSMSRFHDLAFLLHSSGEIGVRSSSPSSMAAARSRLVAEEDEEILRGQFVRPWKLRRVALQP